VLGLSRTEITLSVTRWKLAALGDFPNELTNATATTALLAGVFAADAGSEFPISASPRINRTGASSIATAHREDKSFTQIPPRKELVKGLE
jgi:hypothetical protein